MKALRIIVFVLLVLSAAVPTALAQSITGQISGTLTDPGGAVVPGAKVQLVNDLDGQQRDFTTEPNGAFLFTDLVPGNYTIRVSVPGFKSYQQKAINVSAEEKVALHDIKLEVGDVSSSVTVQTDVAHIATDSSDRSVLVNTTQIENTPIRGRDFMGLIEALPGVVDLNTHDSRGYNAGMATVNGGQAEKLNVSLDGVPSVDPGNTTYSGTISPSVDAIAEVKVLVSNYSAEYTSRPGGQMSVTIKNGTNQYHGSAYYFYRHESLNANEFFNNQTGTARPLYRYSNPGGTIGGPLVIPGTKFNRNRNKLFFFFSDDYLQYQTPVALSKQTMPTALERAGNFSQTDTTTGKLIPIKNPTTKAAYPGNIMPTSQISPAGWAIMNLFPLPNAVDPTGQRQYNFLAQSTLKNLQEDRILRLDYNISPKTQAFVRLIDDYQNQSGAAGGIHGVSSTWGQMVTFYGIESASALATAIHTFSSNLVNEFTAGINRTHEQSAADPSILATNQLPALKGQNGQTIALPAAYPGISIDNLLPNISFANLNPESAGQGITNAPTFAYNTSFPATYIYQFLSVLDNVSWVAGSHYAKFGFYLERMARNNGLPFTYGTMGTYYFGSDTASPYDTGYPYSNLLLGSVQAYGQDNSRPYDHGHYNTFEWYGQDSWKAARHLTLELGARFEYPGAITLQGGTLGLFNAPGYSAAKAGQLLFPAVVNGQNVSVNRQTGAVYPLPREDFFDPASYAANGNPYSGMVQSQKFAYLNPGFAVGPRVGFAWDVLGDGKTAVRGGFGIYYARALVTDSAQAPLTAPPAYQAPLFYSTTISQLGSSQGFLSPQSVYAGANYKNPATYNWSFGVQRNLGKGFILDAAYVGNVTHNKFTTVDSNGVAPYTDWTPKGGANSLYLDSTTGGKAFITANLMRPYLGYGAINTTCSCGASNYNSLQTQVNRRFGKRLQFGANWTWSKTMSYTRGPWTPDYLQYAEVAGDRPQVVNASYSYLIPDGSRMWRNRFTETLLDGWHFNGITKLMAGTPLTVSCTASGAPIGYWTGTPTGGIPFRCEMTTPNPFLLVGMPWAANAPQGRYYPLNAANFKLPSATSLGIGNTPPTLFLGPGLENFDFTMLKDIRLGKESKRTLELRAEAYNVFNHFNPGNPNTSLTLSYTTGANTNANFGSITAATLQARHMALGAKFRF